MVQHALEMEAEEDDEEEELESLMAETASENAKPKNSNGHLRKPVASKAAMQPNSKARILFVLAAIMAVIVVYVFREGDAGVEVVPDGTTTKPPHGNVDHLTAAPSAVKATETTPKPTRTPAVTPVPVAAVTDSSSSTSIEKETDQRSAFLYSKMATIKPDPHRSSTTLTDEQRDAYKKKYGSWHFWDGDEGTRPTVDYCGQYPNRDIPGDKFPHSAWQIDAVYVNHFLNDAQSLIARAMEAIFMEYGHGKPLPPEQLKERMKMFHWDRVDLSSANAAPPEKYAKRGDRGNGGWTTDRSYNGLVQRLLHAMITNDRFTVVLAGHSAAAGHGNHFHQSYMMQFHKIMAPIFARLGVQLVTKNMSQGGLGTLQNALASGSLYGHEIDLMLWDSGMTEQDPAHIDLFLRQALIGGKKVPVLWGGKFELLQMLHEQVGADVGEFGNGRDGIIEVEDEVQAKTVPYAARFMQCNHERQDLCGAEPEFCARCWVDRPDLNPDELFEKIANQPSGQVKWHPGWRRHQLIGRVLAFSLLDALQVAIQTWSDGTMGGPPLDDDWWHVTGYYENIRSKVKNLDPTIGNCYGIAKDLPARVCKTPMQARSLFTPRNDPDKTSLSTIIEPADDGWIPVNEEKQMYDGPDAHNPCDDLPEDAVDVLAIVSGRRMLSAVHQLPRFALSSAHYQHSSINDLNATMVQRRLGGEIRPGKGWQVIGEKPGLCNGEYGSICGRDRSDECPMAGHHDARGVVLGTEFSGWLVMNIPNVKEGIVVLKLVSYMDGKLNTRTDGMTSPNNERRDLVTAKSTDASSRRLPELTDLPDTFEFDFAVDDKITTLTKAEFIQAVKKPQRVMEMITLLDDPDFSQVPKTVRIAFRMRNCGRDCAIALSHVYWA